MNAPANTTASLKISLFNPHRLNEAELEQSFIARQQTFRAILADVAAGDAQSPPQHHLVVGQRGMGKTTLLRRLALELQRPPYRERFVPLVFPEEQYVEVDRLAKFWLNCLDALADTLEHQEALDAARAIDATVARLIVAKCDEKTFEEQCRAELLAAGNRGGRRLVLFVENFNHLLARCRSEEYILRGVLSAPGAPVLVAASTAYPHDLGDYGAAFYDGLKPHYLHPLDLDEIRDVILHLAQAGGRADLIDRLPREMPRLAALRDLTGGNPRTAVLLFELFASGFSADAFEDLEALLDVVTPLYQSRLDQLSEQSQTIVGTLARSWRPMSKADISETARLIPSSVSPQLGRLREAGVVEETTLFPGKKTGYYLAERFFNIWYLMRFNSRRQRAGLSSLAHFLEEYHTPAERAQIARGLLDRGQFSNGSITYAMALAVSLEAEPGLAKELNLKAQLELVEQCEGMRERIAQILVPEEIEPKVYEFADLKRRLIAVVPPDSPVTGKEFAEIILASPTLVPGTHRKRKQIDRSAVAARTLSASEIQGLLDELREETGRLERQFSVSAVQWLRTKLVTGIVASWRDPRDVETLIQLAGGAPQSQIILWFVAPTASRALSDAAFQKLVRLADLEPHADSTAVSWASWGRALSRQFGRYATAEQAYRKAIRLAPTDVSSWNDLGGLLATHLKRYTEAEEAYREAIRLDPKGAGPWDDLGDLLTAHLGRHLEAEAAYREAIRRAPKNAWPWNSLGNLLTEQLGRYTEAEEAYREAIRRDPKNTWPWNNLGNLLMEQLGRYAEAEEAYREAIRLDPENAWPWHSLGNLLTEHLERYTEAEEAYREAIRRVPVSAWPLNSLGNLLTEHLGRYTEAEEAYREAIRRAPANAWLWNNVGNLLTQHLGRYAEAEKAYREAIRLAPENASLWNNLGNLLTERLGRYTDAEKAYQESIRIDSKNARPWNALGSLLTMHLGRYAEAEEAYREAIRLDPRATAPWHNLGYLFTVQLGRYAEAEEAYREAIRLDSKNSRVWNALGNLLTTHLQRYPEAEEAYREAIRLDPKDAGSWDSLGTLLGDYLGRVEEAEQAYRQALEINAEEDAPRYNLAFLLRDLQGNVIEARRVLTDLRHPELWLDTRALHEALFAAYDDNWGLASEALRKAFDVAGGRLPPNTRDDWFRASAVLLHLGFGEKLLRFLQELGADVTLLPWFEALRAHTLGDRRHLVNIPLEAKSAAESIYDQLAMLRSRLPARGRPAIAADAPRGPVQE